jgi:hypothetical protein
VFITGPDGYAGEKAHTRGAPCWQEVFRSQAGFIFPDGILRPRYEGKEMETTQWLVTLTFRVTVGGVRSKDDSVAAGLEQLKQSLNSGEDVPMEATVRRITNIVEEEPIFGVRW